ncbi:ZIP family metal transporter [Patescibacteria group bacterium]|nr:ZIP family metal transporter [Patescibacteria group bacterium]
MLLTILAFLSLISAVSLVGVLGFVVKAKKLDRWVVVLVPFAAGTLLGDSFVHLLPHSFEEQSSLAVSGAVTVGFLVFFGLEKVLLWRHCHRVNCEEHQHQIGTLSLVADGLHNFIDGMLVAGSFLASPSLGLATSLAVVAHELPQEIGDFAILIHSGYSKKKAIFSNFLFSLSALAGGLTVYLLREARFGFDWLLPFTAGGFIYIAASGLIPQLHEFNEKRVLLSQFVGLVLGFGVMFGLALLE